MKENAELVKLNFANLQSEEINKIKSLEKDMHDEYILLAFRKGNG